jgi:uncharacterized iron-regulated protein
MRSSTLPAALCGLLLAACATQIEPGRIDSPYRDPATLEKGDILHLATGRLLSEPELLDYLSHYRVVYVGEIHDSVDDHAAELAILKGLEARFPGGVALGLEMLSRPDQESLDAYLRGAMEEKDFIEVWEGSWGANTFAYYREILRLAREKKIPVLALNAGHELRDAVQEKGLDGLDPEDAERLPEVDLDDPFHRAFLEAMFAGHKPGVAGTEVLQQVQLLWDETMAQTAADYLASNEASSKRLVIIAGGNHVRYGFGIPRRLFRRVPVPYTIVETYVAEISPAKRGMLMDVQIPELPMRPAEVYWAIGYADLEGERVKLGVLIRPAEEGGLRVIAVIPGSPAEAAGLQKDDRIVSAGGDAVREVFDLTQKMTEYGPGDTGQVEVMRGEERVRLEVTYDVLRHGGDGGRDLHSSTSDE